jgi:stage IV sporulation protein FA
MARSTPDEIRRRIARRKREKGSSSKTNDRSLLWPGHEEKYELNYIPPSAGGNNDEGHPLFKKEVFLFKILASVLLFLVVAILFRNQTATLDPARNFIAQTMDKDFQFTAVAEWYEDKFGKPLALLPFSEKNQTEKNEELQKGAVPVSGKMLENFEKNGQGIMIETAKDAPVQTINGGNVVFAGLKDDIGKTVIIQHSDGTETWYGNLNEIKVKLFDYAEKRTVVGTVSNAAGEDKTKGQYYFAVKNEDGFIDPIKVIRLE